MYPEYPIYMHPIYMHLICTYPINMHCIQSVLYEWAADEHLLHYRLGMDWTNNEYLLNRTNSCITL